MSKATRYIKDTQKEFQNIFNTLCRSYSPWEVWSDFINMSAISISNACDRTSNKRDEREKYYLQIAKKYQEAELDAIAKMLVIVVNELEANPDQDYLGELFMSLGLGDHWKGQFFTPYNVCRMMAEITMADIDEKLKRRGWIGINDCACGAGALLIAARNAMMRQNINWSTAGLFVAQDIDRTAALMCYIQLSLLGCAGYVVIADTLTQPLTGSILTPRIEDHHDVWYMPCFYHDVWAYRIIGERLFGVGGFTEKTGDNETPAEEKTPELQESNGGQLVLF